MTSESNSSDQSLAEAVVSEMWRVDMASQKLGMRVTAVRPGYARVEMTVSPEMLNGHATCHGGFVFSLADSAFAFACNSYNLRTVAASCCIEFLAPAHAGDRLVADAVETALRARTGIYDITVTNQKGERVALFRGRSHRVAGNIVPAPDGPGQG